MAMFGCFFFFLKLFLSIFWAILGDFEAIFEATLRYFELFLCYFDAILRQVWTSFCFFLKLFLSLFLTR